MLPNRKTKMPPPLKCAPDNYTCCLIKRLRWCLWTSWDLSLTIKRGFYPPIPSSSNLNQYMYSHLHKITEQIFIYVYTISCGVVGKGGEGTKSCKFQRGIHISPLGRPRKIFFLHIAQMQRWIFFIQKNKPWTRDTFQMGFKSIMRADRSVSKGRRQYKKNSFGQVSLRSRALTKNPQIC